MVNKLPKIDDNTTPYEVVNETNEAMTFYGVTVGVGETKIVHRVHVGDLQYQWIEQ